ncbi:hypothetical protein RW092_20905 [Paenibacillus sp. 3LSP]|uniref:hypothetical protein n=1 Tax=Paenibacillus sp. 3LSP TaxID=2800795 RepID=UPI0028FD82D9|nr:hypothetical protein [Paenibacillus sp. 3LSP]MDU0332633.1 hypothetical protein [Paenibacillus sp. 3LSP]
MKIKKILGVLFTSMLLLTMSTSVFAADVTPNAIGIGDTREQAITLFDNTMYTLYNSGPNDYDWYKWTNDTGTDRFFNATLYPTASGTSLNMGVIIYYPSSNIESTFIPGQRNVPSNGVIIENLYIPAGAVVYLRIGNDLSGTVQYNFNILTTVPGSK